MATQQIDAFLDSDLTADLINRLGAGDGFLDANAETLSQQAGAFAVAAESQLSSVDRLGVQVQVAATASAEIDPEKGVRYLFGSLGKEAQSNYPHSQKGT